MPNERLFCCADLPNILIEKVFLCPPSEKRSSKSMLKSIIIIKSGAYSDVPTMGSLRLDGDVRPGHRVLAREGFMNNEPDKFSVRRHKASALRGANIAGEFLWV